MLDASPPPRSSRRPVILAIAITATVVLALAGLAVWLLWPQQNDAAPTATAPPAPATSAPAPIALDSQARMACEMLDKAVRIRATPEQLSDFNAGLEEFKAHTAALGSTVEELKTIALSDEDNGGPYTADQVTDLMREWCNQHWTP